MSKAGSALIDAATAFDTELATYTRLGELFLKTPLTSLKQLERANLTLSEIADCEQRLQDAGKRLVEALSGARQRQEQLSSDVVGHAPTVQARNAQLRDLTGAMAELAGEVAGINTQATPGTVDPGEMSAALLALSQRAEALATRAHEADFEELSAQAHALHQRLKAIGQKLQRAAGN